jgi:HAD superfamily hydrolase (TIGR01549 family)
MPNGLSLKNFKAILFDVDGTLVNTLPALIFGLGDTYEHFNGFRPSNDQIQSVIGLPLREQMRMFTGNAVSDDQVYSRSRFAIGRFEHYADRDHEFAPAVRTLSILTECGFSTALVTSKSAPEIELFRQRYPWSDIVSTIVCSSDVMNPKPDPESARLACARLNVETHEALFIGDSVFDMQCAKGAGNATLAVGYGSGKPEALKKETPDLFVRSPEDLLAWATESLYRTPCLEKRN